jgi:hypothetical protein
MAHYNDDQIQANVKGALYGKAVCPVNTPTPNQRKEDVGI